MLYGDDFEDTRPVNELSRHGDHGVAYRYKKIRCETNRLSNFSTYSEWRPHDRRFINEMTTIGSEFRKRINTGA